MANKTRGSDGDSAITSIISSINKKMNLGTIAYDYGKENPLHIKQWLSTGIPTLDICLRGKYLDPVCGNGGVPCGRVFRIDGESGGGKSLIAWNIVVDAIDKGGAAIYFDIEKAITEEFAKKLGLNEKKNLILVPNLTTIEKVFETAYIYLKTLYELPIEDRPPHGVVVIDSVQSMMTEDQLVDEDKLGGSNFGKKAKLMGEVLQKILPYLDMLNHTLILTNQLRTNINKTTKYEDDWVVPTSNASEFYAQQIIRVYKSSLIKDETDKNKPVIGQVMRIVTKKSRYTAHGKQVKVDLLFKEGLQNELSVLEAIKALGLVSSAGSKGSKIIMEDGTEFCFKKTEFIDLYRSNPDLQSWATRKIEETYESGGGWFQTDDDLILQDERSREAEEEAEKLREIQRSLSNEKEGN